MKSKKNLSLGSTILTIGYIGLLSVSFVITQGINLDTKSGRHLLAGALANAAFTFAQILITNFALRKRERWAWWANLVPTLGYGITILIVDATHVQAKNLFLTLLPQVGGLIFLSVGLVISGIGLYKKDLDRY